MTGISTSEAREQPVATSANHHGGRSGRVPTWLLVAVLAAIAGVIAMVVQRNVWPTGSGDADEFLYQFQARMLLGGHLSLPLSQGRFFPIWLSGPSNGHRVLPFTWTWPAVLAASRALFHTMLVAVGGAAAAATTFCYLFAHEVLRDRRRALTAAALFTLTPFVVVIGGTYLNYLFALALLLCFGWLLLSGLSHDSRARLAAAGAAWGLLTFTRPFDGILAAVPFAAYVLVSQRRSIHALVRTAVGLALGAVPVLALTLVANVGTTGSALTFPTTAQSGGAAKFFWGRRGLTAGAPKSINFSLTTAFDSLGRNISALPDWLLGTWVALALAVYGAFRIGRERPRTLVLLLGLIVIYPLGYLTWFASELTVAGANDGIGPHYYLPLVVPVVILVSVAVTALWDRHRALLPVVGVAALALTWVALQPKLDTERFVRSSHAAYVHEVDRGLRPWADKPTVVVLEPANITDTDGLGRLSSLLVNPPDLRARHLYALDRGSDTIDLLHQYPDRTVLRLVRRYEPGDDLRRLRLIAKPLAVVSGSSVVFHTHLVNTTGKRVVSTYLSQGGQTARAVLDRRSVKGRSYDVAWVVAADGSVQLRAAGGEIAKPTIHLGSRGSVVIGLVLSDSPATAYPDRWERTYLYRLTSHSVEVLTGDTERAWFGGSPNSSLPLDVGQQIDIEPRHA